MDIASNIAAQAYGASRQATQATPLRAEQKLGQAADEFAKMLQSSENTAMSAMSGQTDTHTLVETLAQTELAVQATIAVRDKVVEAYQEILRMPV